MWGNWFFYTLINYPFVMLLAALLMYATGLMPATDQELEQTQIAGIGLLIWFGFSFVLQITGWWTPIVQGVRRLESNPLNCRDEIFPLLLKLVLVLVAILPIIFLAASYLRWKRSIRATGAESVIVDLGAIRQV